MKEFLNEYMKANREFAVRSKDSAVKVFKQTTERILEDLGRGAFRLKKTINAAVAESIMYAVASGIEHKDLLKPAGMRGALDRLLGNEEYIAAVTKATADEENVRQRLRLASQAFRQ
jgi:hypothetical protein